MDGGGEVKEPFPDKRWRWAIFALAVIGSVDLVQLVVVILIAIRQ